MKDLWFRVLIAWYRLTGSSPVQAEWKARRAAQKPGEAKAAFEGAAARTADRRYNCVCGQLLVAEDKVCHACGRRQYLPFGVRKVFRALGLMVPSVVPASILAGLSMIVGYAIQLRYGSGGFLDPSPRLESYELGSAVPSLVMGSQPWRAFTYTMLHGGLMHIAFNAIALMQVGPLVEQVFGSARFAFCWVVGGVLAAVIPAALGAQVPMIGASGSVFALIGMALIWGHLDGTAQGRMVRDVMVRWVIYATVFGLLIGGVAHSAHFAGLGSGALFGWILRPPGRDATRRRLSPVLALVAAGVAGASLVMAGLWFAADRPIPADLSPGFRGALMYERGEREGWASVFGPEALAVFEQARAVREAGHPPAEMKALDRRVGELMAGMDEVQAAIFQREVVQRLYPDGRPVDPYDRQR